MQTVTIPEKTIGRPMKYDWANMEIGNSRYFQLSYGEEFNNLRSKLNGSIRNFIKDSGKQFSSRKEDHGIRVWRIK